MKVIDLLNKIANGEKTPVIMKNLETQIRNIGWWNNVSITN